MSLKAISRKLAVAGVNHKIVTAAPATDERTAIKLMAVAFKSINMTAAHNVILAGETRRQLAAGLMPIIKACSSIKESVVDVTTADKGHVRSVVAVAGRFGVLAATAMDALADGEPAHSSIRCETYDELARMYRTFGETINDALDSSDSTFSDVEIDLEYEPGHHSGKSTHAAHASVIAEAAHNPESPKLAALAKMLIQAHGERVGSGW
jgi:hypothetical protein